MKKQQAQNILDELIKRLPKRMQMPYELFDSELKMLYRAAKIDKVPIKQMIERYNLYNSDQDDTSKLMIQGYIKSRRFVKNSIINKYLEKRYGIITALSYIPILINHSDHESSVSLQFTYLHEVGHNIGLSMSNTRQYSEKIADRIALSHSHYIDFTGENV